MTGEEPLLVAEWAIGFLAQGIDFLMCAVERNIFPGGGWTLRDCCVTSPVPGPPSELALVDAEDARPCEEVQRLPSKLKKTWVRTVREFLPIIASAPTQGAAPWRP